MRIDPIQEGSGVSMELMHNGEFKRFNLTLMVDKRAGFFGEEYLEYGFVAEDGSEYFHGPYSGGATGFGRDPYDLVKIDDDFSERYRILTSDRNVIQQIALANEEWNKEEDKKAEQRKEEKIERINALPETFDSCLPGLVWKRSEAYLNLHYSHQIRGGRIELKPDNGRQWYFDPSDFVTRDGKRKVKAFQNTFSDFLGEKPNPKAVLESLLKEKAVITAMIKNA